MAQVTTTEVKELLIESLNLAEEYEPAGIDDDSPLFGDEGLGLDSLDALQLAVALEERWGVTVKEDEGEQVFRTVQTITAHVNARRGA